MTEFWGGLIEGSKNKGCQNKRWLKRGVPKLTSGQIEMRSKIRVAGIEVDQS